MSTWCGALEGFYGEPYSDEARLDLVEHLSSIGATDFAYAPKGDPYQRDRWREPYPTERLEYFHDLIDLGDEVGVRISFVVSPGLDWRGGDDNEHLAAKLHAFYALGARSLGIAFDDVPPGGAQLGRAHGQAVAGAVAALPDDVVWSACPVDYATPVSTAYLRAFAEALPPEVSILWTGPSIVAPTITVADLAAFAESLGLPRSRVILADNFPVNDGAMSGVLHLGPYPVRDPALPSQLGGLLLNLMPGHPLASRVGLQVGVRWWRDPERDRTEAWQEVVAAIPGIVPLAVASSSWLTEPGPNPMLADLSLPALTAWLGRGCRADLPPEWQAELEPWLQAWEWEAFAIAFVLEAKNAALKDPGRRTEAAFGVGEAIRRLRAQTCQLFGIRYAVYPVTGLDGERTVPLRSGVVEGANVTDRICAEALAAAFGDLESAGSK